MNRNRDMRISRPLHERDGSKELRARFRRELHDLPAPSLRDVRWLQDTFDGCRRFGKNDAGLINKRYADLGVVRLCLAVRFLGPACQALTLGSRSPDAQRTMFIRRIVPAPTAPRMVTVCRLITEPFARTQHTARQAECDT